jgi:hypothetical protein
MKFIAAVASLSIFFACGIMSVIFGMPERYIERDVTPEEMVGVWTVTSDSEADVKEFMERFPGWVAFTPWKTITLNADGTCSVESDLNWMDEEHTSETLPYRIISCSWQLGKQENLNGKQSPILEWDLEYSNNQGSMRSLYLYEENGKLILWNFIGDPDDFRVQDFVRVK